MQHLIAATIENGPAAARTKPGLIDRTAAPVPLRPAPPRNFFNNRFVYLVISQRTHGLSIGINLNPDRLCNFDCSYCEVDRTGAAPAGRLDCAVMSDELRRMLAAVDDGEIAALPEYRAVPKELLVLKAVALSGDGEPTLCPNFAEVVESIIHVRAEQRIFFKLILISNATGLHLPEVQRGLEQFSGEDELWLKLETGTQEAMDRINRPVGSPLKNPPPTLGLAMHNILAIGRKRPVVIQSLFPMIKGEAPTDTEIDGYIERLRELKQGGCQISLVQIYSAHRSPVNPKCGHLPLRILSDIARRVRTSTGLKAEVF
jgi:wyosine [tRNA(Phe)-imidazoG37] synthetase (radical SAM superfamily)